MNFLISTYIIVSLPKQRCVLVVYINQPSLSVKIDTNNFSDTNKNKNKNKKNSLKAQTFHVQQRLEERLILIIQTTLQRKVLLCHRARLQPLVQLLGAWSAMTYVPLHQRETSLNEQFYNLRHQFVDTTVPVESTSGPGKPHGYAVVITQQDHWLGTSCSDFSGFQMKHQSHLILE